MLVAQRVQTPADLFDAAAEALELRSQRGEIHRPCEQRRRTRCASARPTARRAASRLSQDSAEFLAAGRPGPRTVQPAQCMRGARIRELDESEPVEFAEYRLGGRPGAEDAYLRHWNEHSITAPR